MDEIDEAIKDKLKNFTSQHPDDWQNKVFWIF